MIIDKKYQTFWPRFWAALVDCLIWLPLVFIDFWIDEIIRTPALQVIWLVISTLSYYIYSVCMHAKYGQTIGKMALGVKVLDVSESKLSFPQAVLRDCVPIVFSLLMIFADLPRTFAGESRDSDGEMGLLTEFGMYGIPLWVFVLLVSVMTNAKRRGVHDHIARSVVVRT